MPKKSIRVELNSFEKGVITEASPVNFPSGALSLCNNYIINKDGSLKRRFGFDLYEGTASISVGLNAEELKTAEINSHHWQSVGANTSISFIVIQVGSSLIFFDNTKPVISITEYRGIILLTSPSTYKVGMANVNGKLIITLDNGQVAVIEYTNPTFSVTYDTLKIRDLFGVQAVIDGKDLSEDKFLAFRPAVENQHHSYNLRNQSWGLKKRTTADSSPQDPASGVFGELGYYPSNSDSMWVGMYFASASEEAFNHRRIDDSKDSKSPTAKGYFVIDALRRGSSRIEAYTLNDEDQGFTSMGVTNLPSDITLGGASVVSEYAGRSFFGGFQGGVVDGDANSPDLSSYVLFSQLVKKTSDIFKCYQAGDPTGRAESDIVDTDGGFIRISGANQIFKMMPLHDSLLVFASTGVWAIKGGSNSGFTATNYSVSKVCDSGFVQYTEPVSDGKKLFYWSYDGIYVISKNQYGDLVSDNITDSTVKELYNSVIIGPQNPVKAIFDRAQRSVRWLYDIPSDMDNTVSNKELIFDTVLKCFYTSEIFNSGVFPPRIVDFFQTPPFLISSVNEPVVVGSDTVIVGDILVFDEVAISSEIQDANFNTIKYIVLSVVGETVCVSFGNYYNSNYRDWYSVDNTGVDALAETIVGVITAGDTSLAKQVPYLITHFVRTEDGFSIQDGDMVPTHQSGCLIKSQWNWANSANSKKWSPEFQAYRYTRNYTPVDLDDEFDTGFEIITTKNKIRGRGVSFSFCVKTEPYKDCKIVGWSLTLNGNSVV